MIAEFSCLRLSPIYIYSFQAGVKADDTTAIKQKQGPRRPSVPKRGNSELFSRQMEEVENRGTRCWKSRWINTHRSHASINHVKLERLMASVVWGFETYICWCGTHDRGFMCSFRDRWMHILLSMLLRWGIRHMIVDRPRPCTSHLTRRLRVIYRGKMLWSERWTVKRRKIIAAAPLPDKCHQKRGAGGASCCTGVLPILEGWTGRDILAFLVSERLSFQNCVSITPRPTCQIPRDKHWTDSRNCLN